MRRTTWAGAVRPLAVLAALGAALAGCGGDLGPGRYGAPRYGGGYYGGGPGYYGSPYYGGGYGYGGPYRGYNDRFYGSPRGYYGGGGGFGGGSPRGENRAQEALRQYWIDRSRQVR